MSPYGVQRRLSECRIELESVNTALRKQSTKVADLLAALERIERHAAVVQDGPEKFTGWSVADYAASVARAAIAKAKDARLP